MQIAKTIGMIIFDFKLMFFIGHSILSLRQVDGVNVQFHPGRIL